MKVKGEEDTDELKLSYYKKDFSKVLAYTIEIWKSVNRGENVPAATLRKWFSLFERPAKNELQAKRLLIENAKKSIVSALLSNYDFNLKIKRSSIKSELNISDAIRFQTSSDGCIHISLTDFLTGYFTRLQTDEEFSDLILDKRKFIEESFKSLRIYLKIAPLKQQPSFYKQTIIVGYLAVGFGHISPEITRTIGPSFARRYSQFLHNETAHICKKVRKLQT